MKASFSVYFFKKRSLISTKQQRFWKVTDEVVASTDFLEGPMVFEEFWTHVYMMTT